MVQADNSTVVNNAEIRRTFERKVVMGMGAGWNNEENFTLTKREKKYGIVEG
jgi:hypothetical protein